MNVTTGRGTIRLPAALEAPADRTLDGDSTLEYTSGPLGTLIAGLGLGAFYLALMWVNLLLALMLTPLFLLPLTWLQDKVLSRRRARTTT